MSSFFVTPILGIPIDIVSFYFLKNR
ncbi:hypothetical protein NGH87_13445 [Staphylococcus xylosus]|nr:hypothetical protein [Staphylococcus xylosus]